MIPSAHIPEQAENETDTRPHIQTFVEVQHWAMNHSKENWKDPWTFDPERFLVTPEEAAKAGNNLDALQAFSVGPRNCIGRK